MEREADGPMQDGIRPPSSSQSMEVPGLQPQQQYLYSHNSSNAQQRSQQPELYRSAPLHSSYGEGRTAMQQPQYLATPMMNGGPQTMQQPLYPPIAHQYAIYHQHGAVQPPPMPSTMQPGLMRYPIPPHATLDQRQTTGGRGKKDIKRRTKTGCLTCRKRRIKCDEVQPSCRNCAKSKRECLGYDPIFKQPPGPANIQPQPGSAASPNPQSAAAAAAQITPAHPYHPPTAYTESGSAFDGASEYQALQNYAPLDPSLSAERPYLMARTVQYSGLQAERKVRYIAMDDLFSLNDTQPQHQKREASAPLSPAHQQEVADFYHYHYAPGLDKLFETAWYTEHGSRHLQSNHELQDFVAQCADEFRSSADSPALPNHIRSLEARLVWSLAQMGRTKGPSTDLSARIDVVENLLTGHFLDPSKIPARPSQDLPPDSHLFKEQTFWHNLAQFTATRDDRPDTNTHQLINDALSATRGILGMLENRDVLYSIAIARHIGGRLPEFHPQRHIPATTNDPNDEVNKLKVAHHFVEVEDLKGTTQVIQRICSMALRAWVLQKQ
ncbi:hypothetical protein LTR62_002091 [Meristemomyces frigidus]|uniref:Zn(2)-C6 fungal-type domain-containing protein n=1 Tax=Meristemomyces frigidus TaxID=1508187 RepID=A0AAN7YSF2_9PEZI|nr:hypothetical protein LTR62_002091 [Meristemomyces frigidus]